VVAFPSALEKSLVHLQCSGGSNLHERIETFSTENIIKETITSTVVASTEWLIKPLLKCAFNTEANSGVWTILLLFITDLYTRIVPNTHAILEHSPRTKRIEQRNAFRSLDSPCTLSVKTNCVITKEE
jgi:hypothetical protein